MQPIEQKVLRKIARDRGGSQLEQAIVRAIAESGKSYRQLAIEAEIPIGILSRFMTGDRSLKLDTAAALCRVLGLVLVPRK